MNLSKSIFSIAVIIILNIASVSAGPKHGASPLSTQINNMIEFPEFARGEFQNETITLKFLVNELGAISVLKTNGDSDISTYLNKVLNGKLVNATSGQLNKVYQMDIIFRLL